MRLSVDESHSTMRKLRKFIYFHRDLSAPAMSTDSSQVGVALSFILTYFISFMRLSGTLGFLNQDVHQHKYRN